MTNDSISEGLLREAGLRLKTAKRALQEKQYSYCVRQSQECTELSLKAGLRKIGIEPPKWHDVSLLLREKKNRFPKWFQEKTDRFAGYSRLLRSDREISMYGDEMTGSPASSIFHLQHRRRKARMRTGGRNLSSM